MVTDAIRSPRCGGRDGEVPKYPIRCDMSLMRLVDSTPETPVRVISLETTQADWLAGWQTPVGAHNVRLGAALNGRRQRPYDANICLYRRVRSTTTLNCSSNTY